MKKLTGNGETIVEVLLAVALVGGALTGAYYLLNRSYRQSQAAVERVAATKAAESRVEILRTVSPSILNALSNGHIFCLTSAGSIALTTDSSCIIDGKYTVTITKGLPVYSIKAEWNGLLAPKENLTIYYRP